MRHLLGRATNYIIIIICKDYSLFHHSHLLCVSRSKVSVGQLREYNIIYECLMRYAAQQLTMSASDDMLLHNLERARTRKTSASAAQPSRNICPTLYPQYIHLNTSTKVLMHYFLRGRPIGKGVPVHAKSCARQPSGRVTVCFARCTHSHKPVEGGAGPPFFFLPPVEAS